ncbi:MAG: hypothetical protein EPO35_07845, partial [Acidobacteria bacterium]
MNRWLNAVAVLAFIVAPLSAQKSAPRPLAPGDIDDIAALLKLEDTRAFDEAELGRILKSAHPEVRRRAVMTLGRIVSEKARPMLAALVDDKDPEILATVAWAMGQQKDPGAVAWLGRVLNDARTPAAIGKEAAQALGKIRSPEAHAALATYLANAPLNAAASVVGEALLSTGRFTTKEDIAPILRWVKASNAQVRWRAAWALYRPRNPLATPHLLAMTTDSSAEVRFWSMRGLNAAVVAQSSVAPADASARLRQALNDPDRRVRTEALSTLGAFDATARLGYDDDATVAAELKMLESSDTWLSVPAAQALARHTSRAAEIVPALLAASTPAKPRALRITVLPALVAMAPDAARALAASLAAEDNTTAKNASAAATRQLDAAAARAAGAGQAGAGRAGGAGRGAAQPPVYVARPDAEYH